MLSPRNVALPLHKLHHLLNKNGWHISRDSAVKVDTSQTGHVPATDHTHAAHWAPVIEPRFRRCLARAPFRKAPPVWSFPAALWRLMVDSNTFRSRQRHGIGFEQRATRPSVFDEVFRSLVWHMSVSRRTHRSWHVSQGFTLSKNNSKSGNSGLQLVHTLDTAEKAHCSQLWKLVNPQLATRLCNRLLPASTQRTSNISTWRTAGEVKQPRRISRQHSTTSCSYSVHASPIDIEVFTLVLLLNFVIASTIPYVNSGKLLPLALVVSCMVLKKAATSTAALGFPASATGQAVLNATSLVPYVYSNDQVRLTSLQL